MSTLKALPRFFTRPEVESGPCKGAQTFIYVREVTLLYEQFRRSMDQAMAVREGSRSA